MLKKLVFQVLALFAISTLFSAFFHYFGVNYFIGFLVGTVLQIFAFSTFNTALTAYVALKNKKLENERIKEFSYQGLDVVCPCYKKVADFVPVKLNTQNYYKCKECNKTVSIQLTCDTAITTEPIISTELPIVSEELIKQLQERASNANT